MARLTFALLIVQLAWSVGSNCRGEEAQPRWKLSKGVNEAVGPEWHERHKKNPKMLFADWGKSDQEIIEILLKNPDRRVWSVDDKGHMRTYDLEDLQWKRESEEWNKVGSREYLVAPPIGDYIGDYEGTSRGGGSIGRIPRSCPFLADRYAIQVLDGPADGRCRVSVSLVGQDVDASDLMHEILRRHVLGNPRAATREGGVVIESDGDYGKGYSVTWTAAGNLVVHIGGDRYPEPVVKAYLQKYPSTLPKDLKIDMHGWAERELARCLKEIKAHVEDPDERLANNAPYAFGNAVGAIGRYFGVGPWWLELGQREGSLYEEHVAGKEWRSDYDSYRKGLVELRRESIKHVEDMVEKSKVGIRFEPSFVEPDGRRRRCFIVGEKSPGAWLRSPKLLVPLAVAGLGGTALLIRSRLRTAATTPAAQRQAP